MMAKAKIDGCPDPMPGLLHEYHFVCPNHHLYHHHRHRHHHRHKHCGLWCADILKVKILIQLQRRTNWGVVEGNVNFTLF